MRASVLALALSLAMASWPNLAPAQSPAAGLRAMLGLVPDLGGAGLVELHYGGLAAARSQPSAGIPEATADPVLTQLRAMENSALGRMIRNPGTDWRGTVGFGLTEIESVVSLTGPPVSGTVLRLTHGAGAAVAPALAAAGYAEVRQDGLTAWARGAEDFRVDIAARNPDDPFGAGMGRAARVRATGDLVRHAAAWPVLAALEAAATNPLAEQADIAALLNVLDRVSGPGAVISATILTDAGRLGLGDPAAMLSGSLPPREWQPQAWRMALLADVGDGPASTGVLALTLALPDSVAAEGLRQRVDEGWSGRTIPTVGRSMAELVGAPAIVTMTPDKSGLWVLAVRASAPTTTVGPGIPRNAVATRLYDAMIRRDLVFLQP